MKSKATKRIGCNTYIEERQNIKAGTEIQIIERSDVTSRVFLEKLIVAQLVSKSPAFYGNRRLITVFTRARHRSLF
jgi:hypothetical protein